MNRRTFFILAAIAAVGSAFAGDRPNVLFILKDDQRFDTVHALGNDQVITPVADTLVAAGTTFRNFYIMGGNSGAVCLPSRAMFNTGRGLFSLAKNGNQIGAQDALLGETFRNAGYETFGVGKWHNGQESYYRSFTCGGPIMLSGMSDQFNPPLRDFDPSGKAPIYHPKDRPETAGKHSSEIYADAAVNFLAQHDPSKPFFVYLAFQSPHDPRTAPPRYHAMYDPEKLPLPSNYLPEHPFRIGDDRIRDEKLAPFPRTPDIVRKNLADYYAMVTHDDYQIGRVIQLLKDKGIYDNTIIVFTADNGLSIGQHGLFGKQNVYDCSTHIPLILSGPGVPKGQSRDALCYSIDLFPTLCTLAQLPVPSTVQGLEFTPSLADTTKPHRKVLIHAYKNYERALRTPEWKLIRSSFEGTDHVQLFDIVKDPLEVTDLSGNAEYAPLIAELDRQLQDELKAVGDQALIDRPGFCLEIGKKKNKQNNDEAE